MRSSIWLILIAALAALAIMVGVGIVIIAPPRPLILNAGFRPEVISPNADGDDDVAEFQYSLSRAANITITLTNEAGRSFTFRQDERRIADDYTVLFSGVVDGYVDEGETVTGTVVRRLMPDGIYTWTLRATTDDGETAEVTGTLTLAGGSALLPDLTALDVAPAIFTPNQDGISDRTQINVFVTQPSDLTVYLLTPDNQQIFVPERVEQSRPGEAGMHVYDYEGGVDRNADPPADGEYVVVARAQDAIGQVVERRSALTIALGGKPYGQIVPQPNGATVVFATQVWEDRFANMPVTQGEPVPIPDDPQALNLNTITMPVGDLLVFKLTVENVGRVPLRTTGPEPGFVYDWGQRAATFGLFDESGAWRVGIDCTTAASDYPWRWAIGSDDQLTEEIDPVDGRVYRYLPAGASTVVWGAIRMSEIEARNPQNCWAGLIHEDVGIALVNQNVGARSVELVEVGQ
jgi:hypothetical protein